MGSIFSGIGSFIGSVLEFAVDDILKPVFEVVGDIVGGMMDDPFGTLLTIASFVVPGPWTAYMWVARAALTAAQGGSLLDIVVSAASSYVGTKVGKWAGSTAAEALGASINASGDVIASGIVGASGTTLQKLAVSAAEGAARGIVGASISAVASGDFDIGDIAKVGFLSAVQAVGSVAFEEFIGAGEVTVEDLVSAGFDLDYAEYAATVAVVGDGISELAAEFRGLPEIVQEIIKNTATAAITVAISGGDVDLVDVLGPAIAKAATNVYLTEGIITDLYTDEDGGVSPINIQRIGFLNTAINRSIDAAFAGTDIYEAFQDSVNRDFLTAGIVDTIDTVVDYLASSEVAALFATEEETGDNLREAVLAAEADKVKLDATAKDLRPGREKSKQPSYSKGDTRRYS